MTSDLSCFFSDCTVGKTFLFYFLQFLPTLYSMYRTKGISASAKMATQTLG